MKNNKTNRASFLTTCLALLVAFTVGLMPALSSASGGGGTGGGGTGGGGTPKVDTIKVSKCFYDVPTGAMLIKAASSDPTARLFVYRPDGSFAGEVQNGGGSRYGGTVVAGSPSDPGYMIIISSSGGSITVPTTPFQI